MLEGPVVHPLALTFSHQKKFRNAEKPGRVEWPPPGHDVSMGQSEALYNVALIGHNVELATCGLWPCRSMRGES